MIRKLITSLFIGFLILSLDRCTFLKNAHEKAAATTFKVNVLKGPTAAGLIKAMEPGIQPSLKLGDTINYVIEDNPISTEPLPAKAGSGSV